MRIRYQNPENLEEFIIEDLDESKVSCNDYITKLHKNELCNDPHKCDGENCKVWIDIGNDFFVLAGVED